MAAKRKKAATSGVKIVARNKEASRRWEVLETYEAGLVLTGTEVKALREGSAQISDAYAVLKDGEAYLVNLHIGPYKAAGPHLQHEPTRTRKLLLHRRELQKLVGKVQQKGLSLVPLDIHFRKGWAKVTLGLCRGKQKHDRREDLKRRQADREMARYLKR